MSSDQIDRELELLAEIESLRQLRNELRHTIAGLERDINELILENGKLQLTRYQKDVLESAANNRIWLNAFRCIRPTDEFKLEVADIIFSILNNPGNLILCDFDGGPFESLKQKELVVRISKS